MLGASLALWVSGCPAASQTCETSEDCGEGGQCESTGFCSFVDEACPSGRRYGASGPDDRGGECALAAGTTTGAIPPPPPDESTSGDDVSSSTSDDGSESSTGSDDSECTLITVDGKLRNYGGGYYTGSFTPLVANATVTEEFILVFRTDAAGTFTLGQSDWASEAVCPHCLAVTQDGETSHFAIEGQVTVATGSTPQNGRFQAYLEGVRLQELEFDRETGASIFVRDGACLSITDVAVSAAQIPGWHCPSGFYQDGECDCGCGLFDPDCGEATVESCTYCDLPGSCGFGLGECPGAIDPTNIAACDPTLWTCNPDAYAAGDDVCDCGCGLVDPDCDNFIIDACTVCSNPGSCAVGMDCVGSIDAGNNGQCVPVPGWTCTAAFYGDGSCDCGCGVQDIDCETPMIESCQYCGELGSCSELPCGLGSDIDPNDPTQCLP